MRGNRSMDTRKEPYRAEVLLKRYMSKHALLCDPQQTKFMWNTVLAAYSKGSESINGSKRKSERKTIWRRYGRILARWSLR